MNLWLYITLYAVTSLFLKWIISWGGAKWIEGWRSFFLIDWFALDWTAEQIRFYALLKLACLNNHVKPNY